ncbi:hypothetical protein C0995_013212 [Termitomyces sp. Mi166|nr:hypothetical protein C0995_013212 [Termitomyces sp. Mi166\
MSDDSIVLDDLVRTAEASRLRRRGAMRHHPSFITVTEPWDDDDDDDEDDNDNDNDDIRNPRRTRAPHPPLEYTYTLFCGSDISPSPSPFTPSILPLFPSPSAPPPRATNRCGTLLHLSAAPRHKPSSSSYTFHALPTGASPSLVPLDPSYIDDPTLASLRIHSAPCGCARKALACAICGNILGTRFTSCPTSARASHSSSSSSKSNMYSYTFLSSAVTSEPVYVPSSSTSRTTTRSTHSPQTYPPLLDRLITASPTPLTDEERTAYYRARPTPAAQPRYSFGYGGRNAYLGYSGSGLGYERRAGAERERERGVERERVYEPDGEHWEAEAETETETDGEPGSPDKAGEGVLVPER